MKFGESLMEQALKIQLINQLEYWLFQIYNIKTIDESSQEIQNKLFFHLENLKEHKSYDQVYAASLSFLENEYLKNKSQYNFVSRRQIEKTFKELKFSTPEKFLNKTYDKVVVPTANKLIYFLIRKLKPND